MLSFFSITWNGVRLIGIEPGQVLLALAAAALALDALRKRQTVGLPRAMIFGALLMVLAGALSTLLPVGANYLAGRMVIINPALVGLVAVNSNNLIQLAKFEVALLGVPLAVLFLRPSIAESRRLAGAWALSAVVSAVVAVTDASGHTSISTQLLGYVDASGRESGLTAQPNHLSVSMALAAPVLLLWIVQGRPRVKLFGVFALGIIAYASLLAGSRGGFGGLVLAAVLFILVTPRLRLPALVFGVPMVLFLGCIAILFLASVLSTIATDIRLSGNLGAASDVGHVLLLQQAIADWHQSPIFGIGFDYLTSANEVHLELLAGGGLMALLGFVIYWTTVLRRGLVARRLDPGLASALFAVVITFLALNFLESPVSDAYLYVPAALLVSMAALQRRGTAAAPRSDPQRVDVDPSLGVPRP
jgi:hypothetical protein